MTHWPSNRPHCFYCWSGIDHDPEACEDHFGIFHGLQPGERWTPASATRQQVNTARIAREEWQRSVVTYLNGVPRSCHSLSEQLAEHGMRAAHGTIGLYLTRLWSRGYVARKRVKKTWMYFRLDDSMPPIV